MVMIMMKKIISSVLCLVISGVSAMVFIEEDGVIVKHCDPYRSCRYVEHMYLDDENRPYTFPVFAHPIIVGEYYIDRGYEE